MAVLTRWPHNRVSLGETVCRFAGEKNTGRINEVAIRRGSTVLSHCQLVNVINNHIFIDFFPNCELVSRLLKSFPSTIWRGISYLHHPEASEELF